MFEHFTEGARAVLVEAQDVAVELGATHLGVGHLLYGCAEAREETAGRPLRDSGITATSIRKLLPRAEEQPAARVDPQALHAIGIDYDGVRAAVEETFGPGSLEAAPDRRVAPGRNRKPPFTPEAKQALELTLRVARELHHKRITPGHLLLGLLRLDDDFVVKVVEQSGSTTAGLSSAILASVSTVA